MKPEKIEKTAIYGQGVEKLCEAYLSGNHRNFAVLFSFLSSRSGKTTASALQKQVKETKEEETKPKPKKCVLAEQGYLVSPEEKRRIYIEITKLERKLARLMPNEVETKKQKPKIRKSTKKSTARNEYSNILHVANRKQMVLPISPLAVYPRKGTDLAIYNAKRKKTSLKNIVNRLFGFMLFKYRF